MKKLLLSCLLLSFPWTAGAFPAIGDSVAVTNQAGTVEGEYTGRLTFDGVDNSWWFCVQPDGSDGPAEVAGGYNATLVSVEQGWGSQYTNRALDGGTMGLAKQATIIGYLLDTYLPWEDAGPSGRFIEITGDLENDNTVDFFNAFDATASYVAAIFPYSTPGTGLSRTDFTSFSPANPFSAAEPERQALFNTIVSDVIAKDAVNYFAGYAVSGSYGIVNTNEDHNLTSVAQDLLVILAAPIPEPSSAMLAVIGGGLALTRRSRGNRRG